MAVPLATTTITVSAPAAAEPYETPTWTEVASGVRAHISGPAGSEQVAGGSQEDVTFPFACDPVAVDHRSRVTDERTGEVYDVVWAHQREGLGLDHVTGALRQVTGVPA